MVKRIGIYAGSFNPVHVGHVAFALQAAQAARLDEVYFLPERHPRHKPGVEHFGHRVAMLKQAARPYSKFGVLELHDINFTVAGTLPRLQKRFKNCQLVLLMGSDIAEHLPSWPQADKLLAETELVVGIRGKHAVKQFKNQLAGWPIQPRKATVFKSYAPYISSHEVREGLLRRQKRPGVLRSVQNYSNKHWLYVSFAG